MADAESGREHKSHKRQTAKSKGKPKSRWRKPSNLINTGNKEKGHAFAEKRKKIALREYKKLLKKTREEHRQRQSSQNKDQPLLTRPQPVSDTATRSEEQDKINHQGYLEGSSQRVRKTNQHKRKAVNKFKAAESEFKKRKLEKEQQIKEREVMIQKHREEVREKMKKRRETFGRLNRRTRKGQPIMANQIEHLLGKIQSQT